MPATSAVVQHELGLTCGAFDINAACSGFVYGLVTAHQFVAGGSIERVLLIGSETLSRIIDWDDRSTAVLFADGAGAVVVEAHGRGGTGSHLLGWDLGCDGSARSILDADIGGYIHMEGREVFRRAVRVMIDSGRRAMDRAGVTADDIALVVPHQANIRIIESANAKLGLPMERTAIVLEHTGNTSSASIPLALVDADRQQPPVPRRPRHVRRLRRRHDMGLRHPAVGPVHARLSARSLAVSAECRLALAAPTPAGVVVDSLTRASSYGGAGHRTRLRACVRGRR